MSTGAYRKAYLFAWWEGGEWKQRRPPRAVAVVLHSEGYMFPTFSSSCRANFSRGYLHIGVWPVTVLGSPLMQLLTVWTLRYVSAHSPDPACFTCVCTWRHGTWSREVLRGDNGPEDLAEEPEGSWMLVPSPVTSLQERSVHMRLLCQNPHLFHRGMDCQGKS